MTAPATVCVSCGFASPAGFKFCGQCGSPLSGAAAPGASVPSPRPASPGEERRQLTVMFCDLVGSTTLAERVDAEEFRDIVSRFQRVSGEVIDRYHGYVAQYLGDGMLVYFGYPEAHEDSPRRAVHAGLGILEAVARLGDVLRVERGIELAVRVGIHTGEVVTGDVGRGAAQEQLALGQAPNVAARLQAEADANTVRVSGATYRLVRDFFTAEALGTRALKGISRPIETYRVLGETGIRTRFEGAAERQALAPLIGRERELDTLKERFDRAQGGETQAVLIEAGAGIGKSRLLKALEDVLAPLSPAWWSAGGSPYASDTPLYPLIALVEHAIDAAHDLPADLKLDRVRAWLRHHDLHSPESEDLLGRLLSLTNPNPDLAARITPQRGKAQILELLLTLVHRTADERPLVVTFEDLHWIDPSTLEFIGALLRSPRQARLLLLLTFRPGFAVPWPMTPNVQHLALDNLTRDEAARLAERVAGRALPAEVVAQITDKTDGVPLFVEELTRGVVESGQLLVDDGRFVLAGPLSALEIPDTLQDSLMARLDRLQDLKELAQLASVLGREFDYELLAESYPALTNLGGRLERLVDAGLLFQHGAPPTARYVFRHALLQDAAYGSLLKSRRRQHHERVALTLERQFTTVIEARPEVAAHHFTEAGLADPAIRLWQRAGEMSLGRSANVEAINHLNKALTILDRLPADSDRDRKELPLQTSIAAALNTTRGYASPDVERAFARARAICDAVGDQRDLFWNIRASWSFYIVRADFPAAMSLGEQLLRVAMTGDDPVLVVEAQYTLGTTKFWISDLDGSLWHFEQALALGTLADRTALRYTGQHTGVVLLAQLSWLRWLQGFPEEARARSRQALALADDISNPLSVTMALFFSIWVHQFLGERDLVIERAREVIARSREQGLFYELLASLFIGWTMAVSRPDDPAATDEGIRMMRLCLDMNRGSGARLAHTYYLSLLLEACIGSGRFDEAGRVLAEAVQTVETTGETFWLPELHRLAGELALAGDAADARSSAESSFRRALSEASACSARALEARAAQSLAAHHFD